MDGRLACHLARLFAEPTTTTHRDRAAAAAVEQCQFALDGANELFGFLIFPSTLRSATADASTRSATGENRTHHDVGGGRNPEANIALVRRRVAGVDSAGSEEGAPVSHISTSSSASEASDMTEATELLLETGTTRSRPR